MKLFKKIVFLIVVIAGLPFLYNLGDSQFRFKNIQEDVIGKQAIDLDIAEQNKLKHILAQPYRYLDRGRQSIVFVSQDEQYVIKFFDLRRYKPGWPTLFSSSSLARMKRKMDRLFRGYNLAYEQDRDHAFIVFQQLTPNPLLKQSIILTDRFGFKHNINLAEVPFIVQNKAVPTREEMTALLNKGDVATAKKRLRQLLDMYMVEYARGIYDRDHNFMYNTGFVGNKPIRLDVGRLRAEERYKDPTIALEDLEKIAINRTEGWLERHFPQYRDEIIADMHLKLEQLRD